MPKRSKQTSSAQKPTGGRIDLKALKKLLPQYLRLIGAEIREETSDKIICRCPLHDDRNPSLVCTREPDGTWLWNCFPCGKGGSVIDIHADIHGLNRRSRTSFESLQTFLDKGNLENPRPSPKRGLRASVQQVSQCKPAPSPKTLLLEKEFRRELRQFTQLDWRRQLLSAGSMKIAKRPIHQAKQMVEQLFKPSDILWMGNLQDSGKPKHRANFQSCSDWLEGTRLPARIAAGTFKEYAFQRRDKNLVAQPFIVIESDELIGKKPETPQEAEENRRLNAALFLWLSERFNLSLHAVIDTGGKSLHGWFSRPSNQAIELLTSIAGSLRIDLQVLKRCSSMPLRLPRCLHDSGNTATLCFLKARKENSK